MEQKRTLWIVVAVGLFLLVVLGTAIIISSPKKSTDSVLLSVENKEDTWIAKNTQIASTEELSTEIQKLAPLNKDITTELSEDIDSTSLPGTAPLNLSQKDENEMTVYTTNTTVYTSGNTTTFDLAKKDKPQQIEAEEKPLDEKTKNSTKQVETVKTSYEAPQKKALLPPAKKIIPATKNLPIKEKEDDKYWVQAASYTNKQNAEKARGSLLEEEIPGDIFTYQAKNGSTYYRLRVGPYTTKSEAEYWNKRIKLVDEFAKTQSYVTNSSIPIK